MCTSQTIHLECGVFESALSYSITVSQQRDCSFFFLLRWSDGGKTIAADFPKRQFREIELSENFNLLSESPLLLSERWKTRSHSLARAAIELCRVFSTATRDSRENPARASSESSPMGTALEPLDDRSRDSPCYTLVVILGEWSDQRRGTSDIYRDVARYLLPRDVIVSSLRFLNSPCNKTHPRRQDDFDCANIP